jgi:MFS family permease
MTNVGGIFGILFNTYTGEILGRKKAFMGTVFLTLLGTALSTGAVNYLIQLMGGVALQLHIMFQRLARDLQPEALLPAIRTGTVQVTAHSSIRWLDRVVTVIRVVATPRIFAAELLASSIRASAEYIIQPRGRAQIDCNFDPLHSS